VRYCQVIPTASGGLYESKQKAVTSYKITNDGQNTWQVELSFNWKKMNMDPKQFPFLRMNIVRNRAHRPWDVSCWFVSTGSHSAPQCRGWLILGK